MTEPSSTFTNFGGGQNWDQNYAGAGLLDSMAQTIRSIQSGDRISVGANAVSTAIDVLGFIENPVKALGATAIGWIIEHVTVLDAFLDRTTGDPGAVQSAAETFYQAARDLDGLAADQIRSFGIDVHTYRAGRSPSAVAFEQRIGPRADELKASSLQCFGLGETLNKAGTLVATCRGMMRDLLTEFTWWVFRKGVIALAAAPYTGGTSLEAFLADTCLTAARLAKKFADKLATLAQDFGKLDGFLFDLMDAAAKMARPLGDHAVVVSVLRNYGTAGAKTLDDRVTLSAADHAEQQVAEYEAAEERRKHLGAPLWPRTPEPPPRERQGPGLGARWTTSGTLDER